MKPLSEITAPVIARAARIAKRGGELADLIESDLQQTLAENEHQIDRLNRRFPQPIADKDRR